MDKKQISKILNEMALLMEIKGDNPFKIRAHENAARILDGLGEDLAALAAAGKLTGIKGIGQGMADKITTLLNDQPLEEYGRLKEAIPAGLLEIARIPGMGPKKVKAVWQELDITSVEELEAAGKADRLSGMKGFGAKTQEKILENIELMKRFKDRYLISEGETAAASLYQALKDQPGVIRCEIAGSVRRRKETVGDLDLVVSAEDRHRAAIMDFFTTLPEVETVKSKGDTKSTVLLASGISADLRIVADAQFPYLLHHSTGSKEHNVAMRQRAIQKGLKLNEYGLFRDETNLPCADEEAIFRELGLDFIPPELRENYGEIEAAAQQRLPKLLEMEDLRGVIHTHTLWSDGVHSVEEMARAAQKLGYEYLVISDHSKVAAYANGLNADRVKQQQAEIDAVNARLDNFRILKSIECDILGDGTLDFPDEVLASFDLVIASIHSKFGMTREEATRRLIRAMENPYVTVLGHPTGRLLLAREGYEIDHHAVIDAAAELGVCIEINANPRRLDLDWRFLKYAREKRVQIAICPDAHRIEGYGDVRYGVGIARKGWLEKDDVLNTRTVDEVLAFARERRQ